MEAATILGRIVQREAEKLDKLSLQAPEPLDARFFELLELLACTTKALRFPSPIGRPPLDGASDPQSDLDLLEA